MEARRTLSRGTAAAWIGIALLTAYFVFIGGASAGWLYAAVRAVNVGIVAVVLAVWAFVARRNPEWRPRSAIWPALAVTPAAFALATLLSSNPRLSVEYLAFAVLLVALYLLLVRILAVPGLRLRMIGLAGGLAALISVLYIAEVARHWLEWWRVVGRIAVPPLRPGFEGLVFTDPGGTAAVTLLLASPAIAWLAIRGRGPRVAAVVLAGLVGLVVLLTGARGAWLGVAIAAMVTAAAAIAMPTVRAATRDAARTVPRWAVAAVGIALVVGAFLVAPAVLARITGGGGDDLRVTLGLTGVRMFVERPVAGVGPGNWAVQRAAFTNPGETDYYIPHAHNVYAQTVAEFGLVGIVAVLVVVLVVGRLVLRGLRDQSAERRALALAAIFSLTYLAIHQLVDMYLNVPAILFAGALPIALVDGSAPAQDIPSVPGAARLRRAAGPALAIGCALSLIAIAVVEWRAIPAAQTAPLADRGDWASAAALARTSARDDPDLPAYRFLNGLAAVNEGDLETAERELQLSVDADDYAFSWLDLAAIQLQRGDEVAARASIDRALPLGVQQPAITLPAGLLLLELGDEAAAVDAFATTILGAPMLTDDPWWDASGADLAAAHDEAVARAEASATPDTAALIALLDGRPNDAKTHAALLDGTAQEITKLAIDAWQGDEAAKDRLEEIASASPGSNTPVVWLARLAAKDGDGEAVSRYRTWAAITAGIAGSDIGEDVIVTDDPAPGAQVPGANGNLQGWYVYQRQYPWDLLVPGLPNLTLQ